jgi:hypothetical protein
LQIDGTADASIVCLDRTITGHFQSNGIVGGFTQISLKQSASRIEIASRNHSTRFVQAVSRNLRACAAIVDTNFGRATVAPGAWSENQEDAQKKRSSHDHRFIMNRMLNTERSNFIIKM